MSRPGRALAPGKGPPVPIVQEAGWTPEPVWTQRLEEKSCCLCRGSNLDRPVVQPVNIIVLCGKKIVWARLILLMLRYGRDQEVLNFLTQKVVDLLSRLHSPQTSADHSLGTAGLECFCILLYF
jgi:hypothetical protein